jgi:hypothetical protein
MFGVQVRWRADEEGVHQAAVAQGFDVRKSRDAVALAGAGQCLSVDVGQGRQLDSGMADRGLDLVLGRAGPGDA